MIKTIYNKELNRNIIVCGGCNKPIVSGNKYSSLQKKGTYLCERCNKEEEKNTK